MAKSRAAYIAKWRAANPEKMLEYAIRASKSEKNKTTRQAYRRDNEDKLFAYQCFRNDRPLPIRPRPELCECCGGPSNGRGKLHLDHDHTTGMFRGWICHNCNTGIGKLGDDEAGIKKAAEYLARSKQ